MPFYNPLAWWEDITLMITLHYISKEIKFKSQIISTDQEINCLLWAWPFSWTLTRKVDRQKKSEYCVSGGLEVAISMNSTAARKQNFPIVKWTWKRILGPTWDQANTLITNLQSFYKLESTQIQMDEHLEGSLLFHRVIEVWSKWLSLREPELLVFLFKNWMTEFLIFLWNWLPLSCQIKV